uniref:Uncharacterized protein n=1 Tax=Populus trichocarpa TaxID=3694 RepID=A0A2K1R583_POPTR
MFFGSFRFQVYTVLGDLSIFMVGKDEYDELAVFGNETRCRTLEKVYGQKVIVSWCIIPYILLSSWNLSHCSIFT